MERDLEDLRSSRPRDVNDGVEPTQGPLERSEESILAAISKDINSKPSPTSPRDVRSARNPTWRVRGVPLDFDSKRLAYVLQHHPDLQIVAAANEVDNINHHTSLEVHTLARDVHCDQVATVRFRNIPTQLATLEQSDQLPIDISTLPENIHELVERKHSLQVFGLAIDRHFDDITVLSAPPADKHDLDILAVSGLGGHAFGSFVSKDHGYMWLSESLPRDMPTARVMLYGYESRLQDSTSFANLDDLASSLQIAICRVLRSERKHLILIGHSLGGLLIKEALVRIAESDSDSDLVSLVFGALFFGVPNDGMDIESLIPMVNNQPNRFLLESLHDVNPQILTLQNRSFSRILKQTNFEIFCFYETKQSPTAVKETSGQYKMSGPSRCLVTRTSATSCLPQGVSSDHSVAINRTHSDLVKFSRHDSEYRKVHYILHHIHARSQAKSRVVVLLDKPQTVTYPDPNTDRSRTKDQNVAALTTAIFDSRSDQPNAPCWIVPFGRNKDFVGRESVLNRLAKTIPPDADENECQRTAIEGLGGIGKTQVALEAAFCLRAKCPDCSVFWVPAVDATAFENAYHQIGRQLKIQGIDDTKTDVKKLVKIALSQSAKSWLLVIDNADDLDLLFGSSGTVPLSDYLPSSRKGSILFTTRNHEVVRRLKVRPANVIRATEMSRPDAIEILKRSLYTSQTSNSERITELLNLLANLPLAIKQAAANMALWGMSITQYVDYCQSSEAHFNKLLSREFEDHTRYKNIPNSVSTSWTISFRHISHDRPLAAEYLQFMSCLAEKDIPKDLLPPGNSELEAYEAIGWLKGYAFITERADQGSYDMHRLVQFAVRNWLAEEGGVNACVTAVMQRLDAAFPDPKHENKDIWVEYLPHVLAVLELQDHSLDEAARMKLLFSVAQCKFLLGKYKEAKRMHQETLELQTKLLGPEHPDTLESRNRLASALYSQGEYKAAEQIDQETLKLQTKLLGPEHPDTLESRNRLASALYCQGEYKAAEQIDQETLKLRTKLLGPEHPHTLQSRSNLANALYSQGESRLASALHSQGEYKAAKQMHQETLELRTKVLGPEHLDTLKSRSSLASVLYSQGEYKAAEQMNQETLELRTKLLGPEHLDTLESRNNLANALYSQGEYKAAEQMHQETLELRTKLLGPEHPYTLQSRSNLASVLYSQGGYKAAEQIHQETLELQTKLLGPEHPDTLESRNRLISVLYSQGEYKAAKQMHQETLELQTKLLGPKHPDTLASRGNLANILYSQGEYKAAEQIYQDTIKLQNKVLGPEHPDTLKSRNGIASALYCQGEYKAAEQIYQDTLVLRTKVLGPEHSDTLKSRNNLASAQRKANQFRALFRKK
ncbi:hypothetical protein OIDMADRAFT_31451 [Oidiodendron maius Zn]|uniref:NB-ARC domain-containing protein n=1 Tax=Oidiodendron maius (strain Zn) TaxID=913774 RepID=A0A0C3D9S9_OIDMZ|nr:hypothetical protein OIDMADRAFT_31451 [Oidiodendron maius Zn]